MATKSAVQTSIARLLSRKLLLSDVRRNSFRSSAVTTCTAYSNSGNGNKNHSSPRLMIRHRRRQHRPSSDQVPPRTPLYRNLPQQENQHQQLHQQHKARFSTSSIPPLSANFSPSDSPRSYKKDANTSSIKPYLWEELYNAVEICDGATAEEVAERIVQQHQIQSSRIDGKVFSLVISAWRNEIQRRTKTYRPSTKKERKDHFLRMQEISKRSQKVLQQTVASYENGILSGPCRRPSLEDFGAVMECWYETSKFASTVAVTYRDKKARKCLQNAADEAMGLWQLLDHLYGFGTSNMIESSVASQSHQTIDRTNIDFHSLEVNYMKILELAGRASTAENLVENRIMNQSKIQLDKNHVLNLCYCVLRAHSNSPQSRAADFAHKFLQRMHTNPDLPNPDTTCYNILLDHLYKCVRGYERKFDKQQQQRDAMIVEKMEALLTDMRSLRIFPDSKTYMLVIAALSKTGEAIRAEKVLTQFLKNYLDQFDATLKPDAVPFESVLWSYSLGREKNKREIAERAESLVNNMKRLYECGFLETEPSLWCYNICFKIFSQLESPDALDLALDLYESMQVKTDPVKSKDDSSITRVEIMNGHNQSESAEDNVSLDVGVGPRKARGVVPDSTSINTILKVSRSTTDADSTEKLLSRFLDEFLQDPSSKPAPDAISFSTTISAWIKSRQKDAPLRAESLIRRQEELCEGGILDCQPDSVCYGSVMQAWATSQRPEALERAERILRGMLESNYVQPDVVCWNSVIAAAGSAKMGLKAEELFREMLDRYLADNVNSVPPNAITFTTALHSLAKTGWSRKRCEDTAKASVQLLRDVEELSQRGVLAFQPSVIHYSNVMDSLAHVKKRETTELAESMLRKLADSNDRNLQPNTITYNIVLKAWSFVYEPDAVDKAVGLMNEMIYLSENEQNHSVRPNSKTFGSVLHTLANSQLNDKDVRAMEIVRLMDKYGFVCDEFSNKELSKCLSRKTTFINNTKTRQQTNTGKKIPRNADVQA